MVDASQNIQAVHYVQLFLWFYLGIILSLVAPIALRWLRELTGQKRPEAKGIGNDIWNFARPYLKTAIASAVVGFLLLLVFLAAGNDPRETLWYNAVLYGYAWDSTLQKLRDSFTTGGQ
jgi:formate hydrogenlyase subunit 3/multisubunit Na+/H+ antiporter MnhD subunit